MSIDVEVGLISGRKAIVQAALDETAGTLKRRARVALGVGTGRLLDSSGSVVEGSVPIKKARVQNGDSLTLLCTSRVQIQASGGAFAALLDDGSLVTWGDAQTGGDSSAVQDQLKNLQQIQSSGRAFAAILDDGSVVTWGAADSGGDSSAVQDQLKTVQQIRASRCGAFAAILDDGSVVTWGDDAFGADSSAVQTQLNNVQQIQASMRAFAAILDDGSVVTWGDADYGGDSSAVQTQLTNVQQIQASGAAFAASLDDGSVVTWGNAACGGDSSAVQTRLKNVQQIQACCYGAFAAILDDGSVVTWGYPDYGGDSRAVQGRLKHVQQIQASDAAFAAILDDGSVVTWGNAGFGADSSTVQTQLNNVQQIQASMRAFAAILDDGSVVSWGDAEFGADSSTVQAQLKNVQQIQASERAFAAILADGSVVTWGSDEHGGDSSEVQDQLTNVQEIQSASSAFAAILGDGSVAQAQSMARGASKVLAEHRGHQKNLERLKLSAEEHEKDPQEALGRRRSADESALQRAVSLHRRGQCRSAGRPWRRRGTPAPPLRSATPRPEECCSARASHDFRKMRQDLPRKERIIAARRSKKKQEALRQCHPRVSDLSFGVTEARGRTPSPRPCLLENRPVVCSPEVAAWRSPTPLEQRLIEEPNVRDWILSLRNMSIDVEVGLISGKKATVQAALDETVGTLKRRAQVALGARTGRLLDSSGCVLEGCALIKKAGVQTGDSLTLLRSNTVQVQATSSAFAAILDDGSVVTWGAGPAGDSAAVQTQLKTVQQISACRHGALAAILDDGSVVTWGHAEFGGDSSAVQTQLKNVQQIQASHSAFAAILADGSVIQASLAAFAAILDDGSVVTWGDVEFGADSSAVQTQLKNVQQIQAGLGAFAAILDDGSVVTWGNAASSGGDSSAAQHQLKNVKQIQATASAFAAILADGSVVTWGDAEFGADSIAVQTQLKNVQQIHAGWGAFAAILHDGSVVTWGDAEFGGDSSAVQTRLKNVQQIQASQGAFAAILADGSVVTWGCHKYGADSSAVQTQLTNVQQIQAADKAFAAILEDGSVVKWGSQWREFLEGIRFGRMGAQSAKRREPKPTSRDTTKEPSQERLADLEKTRNLIDTGKVSDCPDAHAAHLLRQGNVQALERWGGLRFARAHVLSQGLFRAARTGQLELLSWLLEEMGGIYLSNEAVHWREKGGARPSLLHVAAEMAAMLIWFEIFGLYFLLRVLRFSLEALVGIFPVTLGRRIIGHPRNKPMDGLRSLTLGLQHFSEKAPKKKKKAPTAPCSHAAKADVGTGGAVPAGADRSNRSPQLSLHVCLVSGRSLDLRLPANAGLAELRWRVEKELSAGSVELIKYATVRNRPILATSSHCNALILIDQEGSVKAWGENVPPSKMLLKALVQRV
eukprot:s157_g2.t1